MRSTSLYSSNSHSDTHFRRNTNEHVNMVRHDLNLGNLAVKFTGNLVGYLDEPVPNLVSIEMVTGISYTR